jgi:hypothetical protein
MKEYEVVCLFDSDVIFRYVSTTEFREHAMKYSTVNMFNVSGRMHGKRSWSIFKLVSQHSSVDT